MIFRQIIQIICHPKMSLHKYKYYGSIWNYIHGFTQETIELNGITHQNYRSFLDNRRYRIGHPYNGHFSSIIDNKMYLPYLLKDFKEYVPEYYFFVSKGLFMSLKKNQENGFDSFVQLLTAKKKLALKQCYSSFGKGFLVLEKKENGVFTINKEEFPIERIKKELSRLKDYICTEYVQQHEYSMNVCSTSLNTIRFLCVRYQGDGNFSIVRCFHRFGVEGSLVDNLGNGNAYLFLVDKETGRLKSNGAKNVSGKGEIYMDCLDYPNNKAYGGMVIPNFKIIQEKILEISNSFPFLRYIGWDVAITETGFKIIEANSLTSLGILQREGGFLDDQKLCKFYLGGKS